MCGPLQNIAHFIVIDLAIHLSSLDKKKTKQIDDSQLVMSFR